MRLIDSLRAIPSDDSGLVRGGQRNAMYRGMKPLIDAMQGSSAKQSCFRASIGTLCCCASTQLIHAVTLSVSRVLLGVPLHLWGIKVGARAFSVCLAKVM